MSVHWMRRSLLATWSCLALLSTGCGGGGGSAGGTTAPTPTPTPTTTSTTVSSAGVSRGTVTGFGSVYINGKRYETDDAQFEKDEAVSSQEDLAVGMVVKIKGDIPGGVATHVEYDEDVKGPVDEVLADRIVVMGQTVLIANAIFDDGLTLGAIQVGDVLEVSGFRGANDVIDGAYVERENDAEKYEVIGYARDVDTDADTFRIGGLVVDYSAAVLDDIAETALADALVEVKDEALGYTPGAGTLIATKVEPESYIAFAGDDESESHEVELEGVVTAAGAGSIQVSGVAVTITSATSFEYGDASDLVIGAHVEVEGRVDGAGNFIAAEVEFEDNVARIDGIVESVESDDTLVVFGVRVVLEPNAEVEDELGDGTFSLGDLMPGDFVEVRGVETESCDQAKGAMTLCVVRGFELERDEIGATTVRGIARNVNSADLTLTILGVDLATDALTRHESAAGSSSDLAAFFAQVVEGQSVVEADWEESVVDPTVAVRKLSLEVHDD